MMVLFTFLRLNLDERAAAAVVAVVVLTWACWPSKKKGANP
jgi:hypothetical protein